MDYISAKTFLAICQSKTFSGAAIELNVTQTTVTARIKALERELQCALFVRNKSGAALTKHGEQFTSYAMQIVQTWHAAKRDLPLPDSSKTSLAIGVDLTLWNPIAAKWVIELNKANPQQALKVEVSDSKQLCEQVRSGRLDVALVHQVEYSSKMIVEHLLDEKLIRVQGKAQSEPYIYIDWGEQYKKLHDAALPELARANIAISLGPVALQVILNAGGSGYFRTRVVKRYLEQGLLELTGDAPQFSYPVYLICYGQKELDISVLKQQLITVFAQSEDWF
ncbi:LysR family transcriptional regulator [Gammaproteobacteria bacterium AS21]